jgi:hypothetical protein
LYVVLEPVNKRLAQLALVLRLGACFVGAASLMFRVAQARLYQASETAAGSGFADAAQRLDGAISAVYAEGRCLTPDQGGKGLTTEFCQAVKRHL